MPEPKRVRITRPVDVLPPAETELPPPGDERREVLVEREDKLAEAAETQTPESYSIDPGVMELENEIAGPISQGALEVSDRQPDYEYAWVNFVSQHGLAVTAKQALGWEIVHGNMPEALERRDELGRRRLGDVILMRIRKDRFEALQRRDRRLRQLQVGGVGETLREMGEQLQRQGVRGMRVMDLADMDPRHVRRLESQAMAQAAAKQIAGQKFDSMIRGGTVPGIRPGR